MKTVCVKKSSLSGKITLPPSKSQTLRAIFFAAIAKGKSSIKNILRSPDVEAGLRAASLMGAKIWRKADELEIEGVAGKFSFAGHLDVANSGIVLRFMTAIAALSEQKTSIVGDASAQQRPMKELLEALKQRSAKVLSSAGFAPLEVQGPILPGDVFLDGRDSQPVSALLIALACLKGKSRLLVTNSGELPWVKMTLEWLERVGLFCESKELEEYVEYSIHGGQKIAAFSYTVPSDWSSAAFLLQAAICSRSELLIENVDLSDLQADKKILELLEKMGAKFLLDQRAQTLFVDGRCQLKAQTLDLNDCVDAVIVMAVLACFADGETKLCNVAVAREKECDRLACLEQELQKMGAKIAQSPDGLNIKGRPLKAAKVYSHQDHRLAMALSVAGLGLEGTTTVEHVQCSEKSFPGFFVSLRALGANVYGD